LLSRQWRRRGGDVGGDVGGSGCWRRRRRHGLSGPPRERHIGTAAPAPASCRVASTTLATSSGGDETPKPSSTRRSRAELLRAARVGRSSSQWLVARESDAKATTGRRLVLRAAPPPRSLALALRRLCAIAHTVAHDCGLRGEAHDAAIREQHGCCNPGATRNAAIREQHGCCNPGATRMQRAGRAKGASDKRPRRSAQGRRDSRGESQQSTPTCTWGRFRGTVLQLASGRATRHRVFLSRHPRDRGRCRVVSSLCSARCALRRDLARPGRRACSA